MKKKLLSLLLAFVMVIGMLPVTALAAKGGGPSHGLPDAPTKAQAASAIGNKVYVKCLTKTVHDWKTYSATEDSITTVGRPTLLDGWYYCTVTVSAGDYVSRYNEGGKTHQRSGSDSKSLTLWYDRNNGEWCAFNNSYVSFYVTCEDDTPDQPTTTTYYPVYVYARVFDTAGQNITGSGTLHGIGAVSAQPNELGWITLGKISNATALNPANYKDYNRTNLDNGTRNLANDRSADYNTIVTALQSNDMEYYIGNNGLSVNNAGSWEVVTASGASDYEVTSNTTTWHLDGKITAYQVIYNANGGSGTVSDSNYYLTGAQATVAGGDSLTAPEGEVFAGWNTVAGGTGTQYAAGSAVTFESSDIMLYAQWETPPTVTAASKTLVTSAPVGVTVSGITYPTAVTDGSAGATSYKVTADVGDTVTLLYKITVTGDVDASFKVTDANTTLVGNGATQNGNDYSGTVGENGTTEFYVSKAFTIAADTTALSNSITVEGVTPTNPDDVKVEFNTYTVTYTDGVDDVEVFEDQTTSVKVGDDTPAFNGIPTRSGYVFAGWTPTVADKVAAPASGTDITYTATWKVDTWYDNEAVPSESPQPDSITKGDGTADENQAVVKFVVATGDEAKGSVTGDDTIQVFTMEKEQNGTYKTSKTVTPSLTAVTTTPQTGYAFDYWTKGSGTEKVDPTTEITLNSNTTTTFYAHFDTDVVGGGVNGNASDGIPDKYEKKVTFKVENGAWSKVSGDNADKFKYVVLLNEDGEWDENGTVAFPNDDAPEGMVPNANYYGGGWDKNFPGTIYGTDTEADLTYTYKFLKVGTINFNLNTDAVLDKEGTQHGALVLKELTGALRTSETFSVKVTNVADTTELYNGTVTMTAAGTRSFTFTNSISFSAVDTYVYKVEEIAGSTADMIYDNNVYYIRFEVSQDGDALKYTYDLFTDEACKTAANGYQLTFTNTSSYVPAPNEVAVDLTKLDLIKKHYVSTYGFSDMDTFNFVATITNANGEQEFVPVDPNVPSNGQDDSAAVNETVTGSVTLSTGETKNVSFNTVNLAPGRYTVVVNEVAGTRTDVTYDKNSYSFELYVRGEDDYGYEMKSANVDSEDGNKITFVNTYTGYVYVPVTPPTTIKVKGLDTVNHVNYIVGRDNGLVDPYGTITRAEVATIYFRLMTEEFRNQYWSDVCSYRDVADTAWYNVAISTLEKAGVIKDTVTGGTFRPDEPITRAELAVLAAQFCTVTGNIPKTSFNDVPTTHWAYDEIKLVEYAGWIEGFAGYFRPDDNLTRAECVTVVNRMLNRGAEPENMLSDMVVFADNLDVNEWYYAAIQEAANTHKYTRTGKILTGEHFNGEKWTALLPATDWAALEQAWAEANKTR